MSVVDRLDAYQRRHAWIGFPLAVVYKYVDDQGNYLAALITYYAFIGVFPLLLVGSSVLGFLLQGNPELQEQILASALRQFPVIGDQLQAPEGLQGSAPAIILGFLLSLYGAVNVAQATQNAMNIAWAVPRNSRPNPFAARGRSIVLLATGGVGVLLVTALSILGNNAEVMGADLDTSVQVLVTIAAIGVTAAVFAFVFRLATTRDLTLRDVAPGAIAVAVLWYLLQLVGNMIVGTIVSQTSAPNAVFALVLGLLGWLFLVTVAVVLCVQINVVRHERLYPRALLTPFTDNVDLTEADRRAYSSYAAAQRTKAFESVDVHFDPQ
ncbi:MAG: YihY/virulence factor BrkB family protein [Actinomycetota bacterium]|nr:YihY/virulence factor BrkB family protein [Actinomycetota bacterium]